MKNYTTNLEQYCTSTNILHYGVGANPDWFDVIIDASVGYRHDDAIEYSKTKAFKDAYYHVFCQHNGRFIWFWSFKNEADALMFKLKFL